MLLMPTYVSLLAILCLVALTHGVDVRISFVTPQQLQPWGKWGTPCSNVTKAGCKGGLANIAAMLRAVRGGVDGASAVGAFVQVDRLVQLHVTGILLNDLVWPRLDIKTVAVANPFFLSWAKKEDTANRLISSQLNIGATNLELRDQWMVFRGVFSYHDIVSPAPGITVGLLFGFPDEYWFATASLAPTLRSYVLFLRAQGVTAVVIRVPNRLRDERVLELAGIGADVCLVVTSTTEQRAPYKAGPQNSTYVIEQPNLVNAIESLSLTFVNGVLTAASAFVNSTEVMPDALKDDAYRADQAFIQQIVTEADANDKAIAVSTAPMPAGKVSGLAPCRDSECPLGTLTTQAIVRARNDEIAFINGGGLRDGWDAGEILRSELTAAVPFQNYLCHLNLTAANILRALEHGVSTITAAGNYNSSADLSGQYLQVHGLRYTVNPSLPPYGRVTGLEVPGADGTWVPIDMRRPYKVVTVNYLCDGGDLFTFGANAHNRIRTTSTIDVWSIMIQYMTDMQTIVPGVVGAIVYDFEGEALQVIKKEENCTTQERYLSEWEVCEKCPIGFHHPHTGGGPCIVFVAPTSTSALPIILPIVGVVLVLIAGGGFVYLRRARQATMEKTKFAPRGGNMTFIFTDIKKSSELWDQFPAAMTEALSTHHRAIRELIESSKGYEVKTIGDAFMVAFACPLQAASFLVEMQEVLLKCPWPQELGMHSAAKEEDGFRGLRVRAGAHYGPANVVLTPNGSYDYDGGTVNASSRVSDSGDGGQIVVTEAFYQAIVSHLDIIEPAAEVSYLGEFLFKGIKEGLPCYQLSSEELSTRIFNDLRNCTKVEEEEEASPAGDTKAGSEDNVARRGRVDKKRLTNALTSIRKWVVSGVQLCDIVDLFCRVHAARDDKTPAHFLRGLLSTAYKYEQAAVKAANAPPKKNAKGRGGWSDADTAVETRYSGGRRGGRESSAGTEGYELVASADQTLLKWPFLQEVLTAMPRQLVVDVAKECREGVNPKSRDGVAGPIHHC